MKAFVRSYTASVTAVLAVVSLALVFAAVLRVGPVDALPHAPAWVVGSIPHVNALLSLAAITTILGGVRAIRQGRVATHRRRMLLTTAIFVTFLALYLYRVALEGPTPFGGPDVLATYVYRPLLAVHVLLAIVCVPLVYYVLLLAYGHTVAELPKTNHPRAGRIAAALWLVSFTLGFVVYVLLYWLY